MWNTNRKVRSTIWLWPFGWSSLLEMDLPAGDEFDDLLDIGIKLRQKDPAPLLLKGKAVGVSGALAHLAQLVKQDLCTPAAQGKAMESTRLPRYVVCAIELQKGFQVRRNISMADRMSLIGAVRGQELNQSKFLSNPPLFTPLGDGNFAVTDFDAGTAIVHSASAGPGGQPGRQSLLLRQYAEFFLHLSHPSSVDRLPDREIEGRRKGGGCRIGARVLACRISKQALLGLRREICAAADCSSCCR